MDEIAGKGYGRMDVPGGPGTGKKDEIADKVLPSQDFSIFCTLNRTESG
jgi:hypothetical protein